MSNYLRLTLVLKEGDNWKMYCSFIYGCKRYFSLNTCLYRVLYVTSQLSSGCDTEIFGGGGTSPNLRLINCS